ncbi:hypothetical protein STEG23_013674, partial [Scotinomys teguina]
FSSLVKYRFFEMDFKIEHTWDGVPVRHEPVCVKLSPGDKGVKLEVCAPFFNDPPAPPGEAGKPFSELWNFEAYTDSNHSNKCLHKHHIISVPLLHKLNGI